MGSAANNITAVFQQTERGRLQISYSTAFFIATVLVVAVAFALWLEITLTKKFLDEGMGKFMNLQARRKIFVTAACFCLFLTFICLSRHLAQSSLLLSIISSAVCILCIVINSFFRWRNPLDAESIENSCLRLGILLILWNLQVLYFHFYYSFLVIFIFGVVLPGIVLFQSNKHFQDIQVNFLALIGYYLLMLFCFYNVFFRMTHIFYATAFFVAAVLVLWWDLTQAKKILDEGDERSIEIHFSDSRRLPPAFLTLCMVFFAFDTSFLGFAFAYFDLAYFDGIEGAYFNPLFPLFAAMKWLFIDEFIFFLMEQKTGGSKLADVFS